jgi:acetylornithine deacetylase/succinyl-diaminopimelate desuccinylase family protein
VIAPAGVGSFARAVTTHYKSSQATSNTTVVLVEPDTAACVKTSLQNDRITTVETGSSIMEGMNCGTISTTAWPILKAGVDKALSISDYESHIAILELQKEGIELGPCGAAPYAALKLLVEHSKIKPDSVVVLFGTEGKRPYDTPLDVSISDPSKLTSTLIQIDSSNPGLSSAGGAGESEIGNYIAAWLEHRGVQVHRLESHPGRPSVVGIVRGSGNGKSIMFNGHIDTVTNAGYKGNALSGLIEDGKIYGRGAVDMKSGVAAAMCALERLIGRGLKGDIILAAVADEEYLSHGTEEVLAAGWVADGAIITEPTELSAVLYHKGFVWFEVNIKGRASHGSLPNLGIDSIVKAGYFLVELDKLKDKLASDTGHAEMGNGSIHAGLIKGGEEPSSYPAETIITIERRTVAGETPERIETELRAILDRLTATVADFAYDLKQTYSRPSFYVEKDDPFIKKCLRNFQDVLGQAPVVHGVGFWADTALILEKGIPCLLFGPSGGGLHAETEWATVESINAVTDALERTALDFCS